MINPSLKLGLVLIALLIGPCLLFNWVDPFLWHNAIGLNAIAIPMLWVALAGTLWSVRYYLEKYYYESLIAEKMKRNHALLVHTLVSIAILLIFLSEIFPIPGPYRPLASIWMLLFILSHTTATFVIIVKPGIWKN
ncbi:MAG: hypothetical protein H6765_01105 [Candidatus Peribacteria bacterium]|nr:MAG: hypothetical protein H6765_01105 [Candidatus Peribacteria bacterium]